MNGTKHANLDNLHRNTSNKSASSFADAFRESLKEIPLQSTAAGRDFLNFTQHKKGRKAPPSDDSHDDHATHTRGKDKLKKSDAQQDTRGWYDDLKSDPAASAVMSVKVSRIPPSRSARSKFIYPYDLTPSRCLAYRGFPVDGGGLMKREMSWKVQIAPPAIGMPPQPLPPFPEVACLRISKDHSYSIKDKMLLTDGQRAFNSGEAWLQKGSKPKCAFFYGAAAAPGKPVRIKNRLNSGSIYRPVLRGDLDMFADTADTKDYWSSDTSRSSRSSSSNGRRQ